MGIFILSLVLAIIFTMIFAIFFKRRGPWESTWIFFLVLLLAIWGVGGSIRYIGPAVYGVYWLPFLLVALIFSLLLAAFLPDSARTVEQRERQGQARTALDAFFWVFIVVLMTMVIITYAVPTAVI